MQQVVTETYDADVWDDLLDEADVSGAYTSLGSYSDEDMERLVAAHMRRSLLCRAPIFCAGLANGPLPEVATAQAYPQIFTGRPTARTFVSGVNSIIHAEVRKLYSGAECPHFNIQVTERGGLSMDYRSSRRMCALAQGFVEGAATFYCEEIEFLHVACVDQGAERCVFEITWPPAVAAAA